MLVALLAVLLMGGGNTGMLDFIANSETTIKEVLDKGDRKRGILSITKEMKQLVKNHNKSLKNDFKVIQKSIADEAEIESQWEQYFARRVGYNQQMLDLRFQLRDQLTREEWMQVFTGE